jgi:Flp pilus assembly protein TadD
MSTSAAVPVAMIRAARDRLAVVPDDLAGLVQLGTGLLLAGETAAAILPLERVLALVATPPLDVMANLGAAYLITGAKERAKAMYERVLAQDPAHIIALNNLGALALEADAPEMAQSYLTRCLAAVPQHRDAIVNLARAERALGRSADAITPAAAAGQPAARPRGCAGRAGDHPGATGLKCLWPRRCRAGNSC